MEIETTGGSAPVTTSDQITSGTTEATGEKLNPGQNDTDDIWSFDQLTSKKPPAKKEEKEEKKDVLPAKAEEALKSGDKKEDKPKGEKSEEKPEKSDKDEPKDKDDGKKEEKPKLEAKKLKARKGDQEIDLDEDATLTVKIEGKDVPVTIKELQANYSGKIAYDKKFSELDRRAKAFEQKEAQAIGRITEIFNTTDPELRFYKMAELSGKDPLEVRREFLQANLPLLEKWYSMSEDERNQDERDFENKILKHQLETRQREDQLRQTQVELEKEIETLRATHQIGKDEYVAVYDYLETLVNQGQLTKDHLTPKFITESIVKDRLWSSIDTAAKEQSIDLGESANEKIKNLVELAFSQGLKPSDVSDLVSELWGDRKIKKSVETKEQAREEFLRGSEPKKPQAPANNDIWSFDQL